MSKLGRDIAKTARDGAISAAKQYYKMSGEGTIWNRGIETYISSKIAERINKKHDYPIELELTYKEILRKFNLKFAVNRILTAQSRFDVSVLRSHNKKPYGVIEVKKRFADFKQRKDIKRIAEVMRVCDKDQNKGLRFGIILALEPLRENQQKFADDKISEQMDKLPDKVDNFNIETLSSESNFHFGETKKGNQITGCCAYSILVYR